MKPQTIFRNAAPAKPYTLLCNGFLMDNNLSLDTRGFIAAMLSQVLTWDFNKEWALEKFDIGDKKLDRMLSEAMKFGYCKIEKVRSEDGTGKFAKHLYCFTDVPFVFAVNEATTPKKGGLDKPTTPKTQAVAKPVSGKGGAIKELKVEKTDTQKAQADGGKDEGASKAPKQASEFERLCNIWPGEKLRKPARDIFEALSSEDRAATIAAAEGYAESVKRKGTAPDRIRQLQNWLKDEPWQDHKAQAVPALGIDAGISVDPSGAIVLSAERQRTLSIILKTPGAEEAFAARMKHETPRLRTLAPREIWDEMKAIAREVQEETRANMLAA